MRITFKTFDAMCKLSDLKVSKHQRNKHPQDQIERLAKIMAAHGVRHPIHVSSLSGEVCFGHGRWEAAKFNKWKEYPVVYQDFKDPKEEYACVQSDNAIASWAELDLSGINTDVGDLGPDFNIDLLGIKDFVLEPAELIPQADEDEVPDHVEPRTKLGDVYQLGRHRLVCGDSTNVCAVDLLMAGEKADMVFTDPPYNLVGNVKIAHARPGAAQSKGSKMLQDSSWDVDFEIKETLAVVSTVLAEDYGIVIFTSQYLSGDIWAWMKSFCHWYGYAVYERTNPTPMAAITQGTMLIATDLICYGHSKGHKIKHPAGKYITNVWRSPKVHHTDFVGHPTQKPVSMIAAFLECVSFSVCLDLFGGSGSTLIACEKTNRKCFMMELDPHYCDVIVARWEKYTGQTATLITGADGAA